MDLNILSITQIGLGTFLGLAIGVLLRFVLIKILIIASIPVVIMFISDFSGIYKINWVLLNEKWQIHVIPPVIEVYNYLNHHALIGIMPGVVIGFSLGFLLTKKLL